MKLHTWVGFTGTRDEIVTAADFMIACPKRYYLPRSGTWAIKDRKKMYIIFPNGQCQLVSIRGTSKEITI